MIKLNKWPLKFNKWWTLKVRQPKVKIPTLCLGSAYGAWVIPEKLLTQDSICYLAGAGEDISFDFALAQKYGCSVNVFDPTPRAIEHFNQLIESNSKKLPFSTPTGYSYPIPNNNADKLNFLPLGLWDKTELLRFYAPQNSSHVSHSAVNLQKTESFFEAKVSSLNEIMSMLNHQHVNYLKLDIEGAEYKVIDSIVSNKIDIDAIAIEFDECHTPLDNKFIKRITQSINKLRSVGYVIYDIDDNYNISFISSKAYEKIRAI